MAEPATPPPAAPPAARWRRVLPWALLVLLLGIVQTLLFVLTLQYERDREQERTELTAASAAADLRQRLAHDLQSLQALLWNEPGIDAWRAGAVELLRARRELLRIEWRDAGQRIEQAVESPYRGPLYDLLPREALDGDTVVACAAALRRAGPGRSGRAATSCRSAAAWGSR